MTEFDLPGGVRDALDAALRARGKVNIVIAGKTGVGKSTLINAVFQGKLADTGQGRPVTKAAREITKEGVPISIIDTRGLEMDKYEETVRELDELIRQRRQEHDPAQHIHLAWLCIAEGSRRVEDGEIRVARMLSSNVPLIVVITRRQNDDGFSATIKELIPEARATLRVRALAEQDEEGNRFLPKGLVELVEASMEVVPEGQRNAFAAAQRVSLLVKKNRAHLVVATAATAAGAVGAIPIPFSDAALLAPIQIGMLAGISAVFGLPVTTAWLTTVVSSAALTLGGMVAGRALVSGLLKLIPGAGSIAGGVIAAVTATALTSIFGEAYILTLVQFFSEDPDATPSAEDIARRFNANLNERKT